MRRLLFVVLAAVVAVLGLLTRLQAQSVRNSPCVTKSIRAWNAGNATCGAGIIAVWPDVAAQVLDRETSYSSYRMTAGGQVRTDRMVLLK